MKYLTLLLVLFATTLFAEPIKIGYINIGHLVTSSPQYVKANASVIKEFQPKEEKLIAQSKKIESLVKSFEQEKANLTEDEQKSRIQEITILERKIKKDYSQLQKQLEVKNQEELGKIETLINKIIKELAQEEAYDLIFYQEVAYASDKVNITPIISKKLKLLFNE